jgi:hypothetical protein
MLLPESPHMGKIKNRFSTALGTYIIRGIATRPKTL